MLSFINALHNNLKVGLYLSDIAGAFDAVDISMLLQKLAHLGLDPSMLQFLRSYLGPRTATVIVGGFTPSLIRYQIHYVKVWCLHPYYGMYVLKMLIVLYQTATAHTNLPTTVQPLS